MTRKELHSAVELLKTETRSALQAMIDELNQGQRKKLAKNPEVKALLDRYGVEYS